MSVDKRLLESQGYAIQPMRVDSQPWMIYYSRDGRAMKLPADVYSQGHYLSLGFSLSKPENPIQTNPQPLEDKYIRHDILEFHCELCGGSFDSNWRLGCHKRTHKNGRLKMKSHIGG